MGSTISPKKSKRKIFIIIGILVASLTVALVVSYAVSFGMIANAAGTFEVTIGEVEISEFSLAPFGVKLDADVIIKNPSSVDFTIDSVKVDLFLETESGRSKCGEVNFIDKVLSAGGQVIIPAKLQFGAEIIDLLTSDISGYQMSIEGEVQASGKYLFLTVSNHQLVVTKIPLDNYLFDQNLFDF